MYLGKVSKTNSVFGAKTGKLGSNEIYNKKLNNCVSCRHLHGRSKRIQVGIACSGIYWQKNNSKWELD